MIENLPLTRFGIPSEMLHPVLGFIGAIFSSAFLFLGDVAEQIGPQAQGWAYLGGTAGLIGCLTYACRTLWLALSDSRKRIEDAQAAAVATATLAATAVAAAVQSAEARMAAERKEFMAAKEALEREIRTDWKTQNAALMRVLNRLDPDSP